MTKAGCSGVSVMRAELDASTSTAMDTGEAQWRAGANRQAQPDAASDEDGGKQFHAEREMDAWSGSEEDSSSSYEAEPEPEPELSAAAPPPPPPPPAASAIAPYQRHSGSGGGTRSSRLSPPAVR